jgi:hypothetical protein
LPGDAVNALQRLGSAAERARYAPELGQVGDLREDVAILRTALADRASWHERLRASLLPRSSRVVWRGLGDKVADGLDAIDAATARATARLRPGGPSA